MRRVLLAVAALLTTAACTGPSASQNRVEIETFAIQSVPRPGVAAGQPRLFFFGLAMQTETWSQNDVYDLAERLGEVAKGFEVHPIIFDSSAPSRNKEMRDVGRYVASLARILAPADLVLVYASTHGAPGLLGNQENGVEAAPVTVDDLQQWLEPLRNHDTILILSACFSGSFIPALKEDHRIIFTAARADRTSFGCQAGADHTVFGEALLGAIRPDTSLRAIIDRTRLAITAQERRMGVPAPSLPQVSVGAAVKQLYDAPVF